MRARDFIIQEASVFKTANNQYVPGYRMAISSAGGGRAISAVKEIIPDFESTEELVIVPRKTESTYRVKLSKNTTDKFKLKRPNGEVIELQGTQDAIEKSLNGIGPAIDPTAPEKIKMPNKGDTAEALLGAAMFAKILKRTGNEIGEVTADDVWRIFDTMKPVSNDDYFTTSQDLGGATDKVWFRLKIKGFVKMALANPNLRDRLTDWMASPVNYVNSKEGTDYANEFYKNGEPDELGIISDGISAPSEKKTDVFTVVRDPETNTVKKELLPVSLKAGAEQFAQHSGSKWKAMEDMFGKMGITFPSGEEQDIKQEYEEMQSREDQTAAASHVYSTAENLINSKLTTPEAEAEFIENVAKAIRFWATSDNDNVRLVAFGPRGKFEVLRFDQLVPMMQKLRLRAKYIAGDNPKLQIKDEVSGQLLIQIRTYLQLQKSGLYQRNVIEKGPLISSIANALEKPTQDKAQSAEVDRLATLAGVPKNSPQSQASPAVDSGVEPPGIANIKRPLAASKELMGQNPAT